MTHQAAVATGALRRKSARQVAAPKFFSPNMSRTFKRTKSSHASDLQAVLEARDKFCKQALHIAVTDENHQQPRHRCATDLKDQAGRQHTFQGTVTYYRIQC